MTLRKVSVLENLFDVLQMRGFIENTTDDKAIRELLEKPVVGYIGFDPTASSLHVGSLVPIMALAHMQRQGHKQPWWGIPAAKPKCGRC
jgi:tyrosyl-tRNA synthetase